MMRSLGFRASPLLALAANMQDCSCDPVASTPALGPKPTLGDLFAARAHFDNPQVVALRFSSAQPDWDQKKLSVHRNPADGNYYAYTRKVTTNGDGVATFNIALMRSDDGGQSFNEVGEIFPLKPGIAFYDAHVSVDSNVSLPHYVMVMEGNVIDPSDYDPRARTGIEWASIYVSYSIDPFNPTSWSYPTTLVYGCDADPLLGCDAGNTHSASTPVALFEDGNRWISWTAVHDDGDQSRTESEGAYYPHASLFANQGMLLMGVDHDTHCTSWWDCNNRDKQDWRSESAYYYLLYNGANYYRCLRPDGDFGTNQWGITIARSSSVFGFYAQLEYPIMMGREGYCNMTYPTFADIDDELYVYYADGPTGGPYPSKRIRLIWSP